MKPVQYKPTLSMPMDIQTVMMKLKVVFRNFAKAPKKLIFISQQAQGTSVRRNSNS
jgi:hypothetical protein